MNNYPLFLMAPGMRPLLVLLMMVDIVLRGMALYRSARKGQTVWFVALLVINSLGILPLIYLLIQNGSEQKGESVPLAAKKVIKNTSSKLKKKSRK